MHSSLNWTEAMDACKAINGTMTLIHTSEENEEVITLLNSESGWLVGFRFSMDSEDERWLWADGEQWDWEQWAPDEPKPGKDCVKITTDGWVSADCDGKEHAFTCRAQIENTVKPGTLHFKCTC